MKEAGIGYGSINHPVDRDPVCGYTGIIDDACPQCGRTARSTTSSPFERIRRITGYLVGTLDNFNNAKAAEVRDRVTHSLGTGKGDMEQIEILPRPRLGQGSFPYHENASGRGLVPGPGPTARAKLENIFLPGMFPPNRWESAERWPPPLSHCLAQRASISLPPAVMNPLFRLGFAMLVLAERPLPL